MAVPMFIRKLKYSLDQYQSPATGKSIYDLPPEVRDRILYYLFECTRIIHHRNSNETIPLLLASKRLFHEARCAVFKYGTLTVANWYDLKQAVEHIREPELVYRVKCPATLLAIPDRLSGETVDWTHCRLSHLPQPS